MPLIDKAKVIRLDDLDLVTPELSPGRRLIIAAPQKLTAAESKRACEELRHVADLIEMHAPEED